MIQKGGDSMNTLLITEDSVIFNGFNSLASEVFIFFFTSGIEITSKIRENTLVPVLRLSMDARRMVQLDGIGDLLSRHGVTNHSEFVFLGDAYCRIP